MKSALILISAVFALLAAIFWLLAARRTVSMLEAPKEIDEDGWESASISIDGNDLAATLQLQSRMNGYGALCAALSAICQVALGLFYP